MWSLCSIRSARMLMEQLSYNLLRQRVLDGDIAEAFLRGGLGLGAGWRAPYESGTPHATTSKALRCSALELPVV